MTDSGDAGRHKPGPGDGLFWGKLKGAGRRLGYEGLEKSLWLYYTLQKPDLPTWAKRTITGALAYLVLPLDAIPDIIPGAGYTDDLAVIAAALASVAMHIDAGVKQKAKQTLARWFS